MTMLALEGTGENFSLERPAGAHRQAVHAIAGQ